MTTLSLSPAVAKRQHRQSLSAGACLAGALGATTLQAGAAPIIVLNHSFETLKLDNYGNPRFNPTDWSPEAFSDSTREYGVGNVVLAPIDGSRELAMNNHYGVFQTGQTTAFSVTSAGQVIKLTVGVGNYRGQKPASFYYDTISLQVGGVNVASNSFSNINAYTPTAPATSFADAWVYYTTTSADIGKLVGIHIEIPTEAQAGYQTAYFDNVRLDVASPIPEPSTILMMVIAVGVLGITRFRRTKHAPARI